MKKSIFACVPLKWIACENEYIFTGRPIKRSARKNTPPLFSLTHFRFSPLSLLSSISFSSLLSHLFLPSPHGPTPLLSSLPSPNGDSGGGVGDGAWWPPPRSTTHGGPLRRWRRGIRRAAANPRTDPTVVAVLTQIRQPATLPPRRIRLPSPPFLPSPPRSGGGEGRRRQCGRRRGRHLRRWGGMGAADPATGAASDGDGEDGSDHEEGDSGG